MNGEKQLGVFWGNDALYFIESEAAAPKKIFHFPFDEAGKEAIKKGPLSAAGIGLASKVKKVLIEKKLTGAFANLSLPTRDIIFRSFVIPWMQEHEIKNVVEFEASKYIPFPLEKLSYAFHPTIITENIVRRIRIIFVAIKSDTLRGYVRFLESASLNINSIEPAASALIRALGSKNLIPKNQTVAIIEKEDVGRILIIDNEIPQFVREFHLSPMGIVKPEEKNSEAEIKKMTGEARISLDYFNRQNEQLQTKRIFLLSTSELEEFSEVLGKTLSIPVSVINHQSILGDAARTSLGFLNAYGASIIPSVGLPLHFDFGDQKPGRPKPKVPFPKKPINYKLLVKTALVCISLIVISIIVSGLWTQKLKADIDTLSQGLGSFKGTDIFVLETKKVLFNTKLANFKKVRLRSDTASFLLLLPDLLPEGMWIESINIDYDDSATFAVVSDADQMTVPTRTGWPEKTPPLMAVIKGYAYSEERNEQFLLVNQLLKNLKNSKKFSAFFNDIRLETTEAQKIFESENMEDQTEYSVTSFEIVCSDNHGPQKPE